MVSPGRKRLQPGSSCAEYSASSHLVLLAFPNLAALKLDKMMFNYGDDTNFASVFFPRFCLTYTLSRGKDIQIFNELYLNIC